ncbi:PAAR domain-containing protein [Chromobacterium sp. ATCC 53434]|uniref:PAAR domain-containing protein n=1 Tax=Chromobacterium sp. (strain ATCC 53434 / SC 14030) TaxID=2059672 RepID=UPI000C765116|nr:PAAR domain-containing protein [Chromobacterium sp. ATCC 53434]AUH52364.1 PAAR domain-containing protein [Chromobacterium sp. ATCC 53434]
MKRVIRIGDPTSHGGKVVSASATTSMFGKAVALIGDAVSCPQNGHVNCVIVEGDPSWTVGGKAVALEGHKVSCGAALISTMGEVGRDYESSGTATTGSRSNGLATGVAATAASMASLAAFDEQIRFFTADRNVLANTRYTLTLGDGSTVEGSTDSAGKTARIQTDKATEITCVEFYPDTIYGCACQQEHMCETGGRAPSPALKAKLSGIKTNPQAIGSSTVNHTLPKATDTRGMTPGEIAMARTVFKNAIDYTKVKIHRGGLFGQPNRSGNAMTPKGEIHFPDDAFQPDFSAVDDKSVKIWFIHEMTHVWQYQLGYSVTFAGMKIGAKGGYSDDGKKGAPSPAYRYHLNTEDKGKTMPDFNMEQQGELVSHYFGATALNYPNYVGKLPSLKIALASFLTNPSDAGLLPTTTAIEP